MIQEVIPEIQKIVNAKEFKTEGILNHIIKMVQRGDSKETIMDMYFFLTQCNYYPQPEVTITTWPGDDFNGFE